MWNLVVERLTARTTRFKILEEQTFVTMERWIELISTSTPFIDFFVSNLNSLDCESYYWEVRPVRGDTITKVFEYVITESPRMHEIQSNSSAFQEFIHISKPVVSFPNLGGDAQLVVPSEVSGKDCYGHLAVFNREAPQEQVQEFWRRVGTEYKAQIGAETKWLSTAGLGVPWLHARIDSRPKYYKHQVYKVENYLDPSLIHEYIRRGNMEKIRQVLDVHGAATVKDNTDLRSPAKIHSAANYGHLEVVKFLLGPEINEDPNIKRMNDFTPLHSAAMEGHTEVVQYLIEMGADVNAQTSDQMYSPMHSAAFAGHIDTIRWLIRSGANNKLLNYRDETPLDTAKRTEQAEVVSYLSMLNNTEN